MFIKGLAKNPRMIAKFAGFPMNEQEGLDLWDEGMVPDDIFALYKQYKSVYDIPNEVLKEFGKNR